MSYKEQPGYLDSLLALRGVSCLAVIFIHFTNWSPYSFGVYLREDWEFGAQSQEIMQLIWPSLGKNLILLFFVHSGYLMGKVYFMGRYVVDLPGLASDSKACHVVDRPGLVPRIKGCFFRVVALPHSIWRYFVDRSGLPRYIKGRFLRIAPLLYFNLLVCLAILPSAQPTLIQALGDFAFLNNVTGRGINGPTWSMSWEMQYYLIAPFVFLIFRQVTMRNLLFLVGLGLFFDAFSWVGIDLPTEFFLYFFLGFAVNIALRLGRQTKFRGSTVMAWTAGLFVGNGIFYLFANQGHEAPGRVVVGFFSAFAIYLLELPRRDPESPPPYESYGTGRLFFHRFLTWTGIISYGVYLWHWPFQQLGEEPVRKLSRDLLDWVGTDGARWHEVAAYHVVQFGILVPITLAVSVVTFLLIEVRFRPNLYRWDNSRFLVRLFGLIPARLRSFGRGRKPPAPGSGA